jgi:hypothetical protein
MARLALGQDVTREDDEQPELAFYHPLAYVLRTWQNFKEHGIYPNGLGYDDQDPDLMADWDVVWWFYNHAIDDLSDDDDGTPKPPQEREIEYSPGAKDWRETLGKG